MAEKIVRKETAAVFEDIYSRGYDKSYPSVDLVRLESWYFERKPGRALDYGCGPGTNGLHLLDSGYDVLFSDVAREALKKVQAKLDTRDPAIRARGRTRPVDLDADGLPDADGTYDYVIGLSVLGNLESQESVGHLLSEFCRVLKPGGKMIIDINGENTTYVHNADKSLSGGVYSVQPSSRDKSESILMYFPESPETFSRLVSGAGFIVDSVGHSSFAYCGHEDYEYIVCAHKPA